MIQLGEAVLAESPQSSEFIDSIEAYAQRFEEWFEVNKTELTPEMADNQAINDLIRIHANILDIAKSEQLQNSKNFWLHKEKARGIMAYTDILPKKVSISRTKKS